MMGDLMNSRLEFFIRHSIVLAVLIFTSYQAHADEMVSEEAYFTAHQVARLHHISKILVVDESKLIDSIVADLIQHHRQGNAIKAYQNDQSIAESLRQGIQETLHSTEFQAWLNERIADTYVALYSHEQLKLMYQTASGSDGDFGQYLAAYINNQARQQDLDSKERVLEQTFQNKVSAVLMALPTSERY